MSIPDYIFKQVECCMSADDNHFLIEPVLLKCGGNACKVCVSGSTKCLHCNSVHSNNDYIECKTAESLIRFFMTDLSASLDEEIRLIKELLKGFYLFLILFFSK